MLIECHLLFVLPTTSRRNEVRVRVIPTIFIGLTSPRSLTYLPNFVGKLTVHFLLVCLYPFITLAPEDGLENIERNVVPVEATLLLVLIYYCQ